MGYTLVKMDFKYGIWIPNFIVWIVTKRGKRLDDKDVRGAFGLRDDEF